MRLLPPLAALVAILASQPVAAGMPVATGVPGDIVFRVQELLARDAHMGAAKGRYARAAASDWREVATRLDTGSFWAWDDRFDIAEVAKPSHPSRTSPLPPRADVPLDAPGAIEGKTWSLGAMRFHLVRLEEPSDAASRDADDPSNPTVVEIGPEEAPLYELRVDAPFAFANQTARVRLMTSSCVEAVCRSIEPTNLVPFLRLLVAIERAHAERRAFWVEPHADRVDDPQRFRIARAFVRSLLRAAHPGAVVGGCAMAAEDGVGDGTIELRFSGFKATLSPQVDGDGHVSFEGALQRGEKRGSSLGATLGQDGSVAGYFEGFLTLAPDRQAKARIGAGSSGLAGSGELSFTSGGLEYSLEVEVDGDQTVAKLVVRPADAEEATAVAMAPCAESAGDR